MPGIPPSPYNGPLCIYCKQATSPLPTASKRTLTHFGNLTGPYL